MSASDALVCLQAGLVVPIEAFDLALRCEALGIQLSARGSVLDAEGPYTTEILANLKRLKPHILALLTYTPCDRHLFDASVPYPEHGPVIVTRPTKSAHGS